MKLDNREESYPNIPIYLMITVNVERGNFKL